MDISLVAKWNKLKPKTLEKQYKDHLSDYRAWKKTVNPDALVYPENFGKRMSIDETTLSQGEIYTIITNKDAHGKHGALAAIVKGTKSEVVQRALEVVPVKVKMGVEEVTLDLANNMDWICRMTFMNATITADRFHVQQVISDGVQELRIGLKRKVVDLENQRIVEAKRDRTTYTPPTLSNGDTEKQLLARSRYLLFKPESKWTTSQKERAEILFRRYPELQKAYHLSMNFRGIFERKLEREKAQGEFNKWYQRISVSSLPELISAGNTIKHHEGKILNYFKNRETNASAESFNSKLKGFRSLLRGVRDMKFFLFRIHTLFA